MLYSDYKLNDYLLPDFETINSYLITEQESWDEESDLAYNSNEDELEAESRWIEKASDKFTII